MTSGRHHSKQNYSSMRRDWKDAYGSGRPVLIFPEARRTVARSGNISDDSGFSGSEVYDVWQIGKFEEKTVRRRACFQGQDL